MNIRHLTFRLLQVYVAVIKTGSISQAAVQLHLSQPTVSQQIKRLTEAVGEPLLEMVSGQYEPTFIGQAFYRAALEAMNCFDDFNQTLSAAQLGAKGALSIGVVTTAQYLLPKFLAAFYQQFPDVEVTLHIGNRNTVLQRFNQQQDDLYIFSHPPTAGHVLSARFLQNPLVLIAPKNHWTAGKKVAFKELLNERFILREQGSATRMVFENWLREHKYTLKNSLQVESNEVIRMSVENGMGLTVLSEHILAQSQTQLCVINTPNFPLKSHWYLVRHTNMALTKTAANFIHFINEHLEELVDKKYINNELKTML